MFMERRRFTRGFELEAVHRATSGTMRRVITFWALDAFGAIRKIRVKRRSSPRDPPRHPSLRSTTPHENSTYIARRD
jgi:hypothetical protein